MHPRTRRALDALPPEKRVAAEAAIARSDARGPHPKARRKRRT